MKNLLRFEGARYGMIATTNFLPTSVVPISETCSTNDSGYTNFQPVVKFFYLILSLIKHRSLL